MRLWDGKNTIHSSLKIQEEAGSDSWAGYPKPRQCTSICKQGSLSGLGTLYPSVLPLPWWPRESPLHGPSHAPYPPQVSFPVLMRESDDGQALWDPHEAQEVL